ncbi:hypothetical protein [Archaeoglobus profundus]|uniref:Uncharacterized protein n=1 Tax=Archaeoglobus profundus (strain DSM 5631 / JCM 9629 / NBRC 100127 / Av18) TaxID=572546 RepID=D2REY8_ARCPA|nr:hypothetical protein [Archaeoglobus profundus]ADB58682.1 hypothetical protein Arcpr_1636 [Archaeoglobus profundus DSM 5631]
MEKVVRKETCPNCGALADVVEMEDRTVLRCPNCGREYTIMGKEEILPVEKKLVGISLILAVILLAILYYISWSMIAHVTP